MTFPRYGKIKHVPNHQPVQIHISKCINLDKHVQHASRGHLDEDWQIHGKISWDSGSGCNGIGTASISPLQDINDSNQSDIHGIWWDSLMVIVSLMVHFLVHSYSFYRATYLCSLNIYIYTYTYIYIYIYMIIYVCVAEITTVASQSSSRVILLYMVTNIS